MCSGNVVIDRPKLKRLISKRFLQFSERFRMEARYPATEGLSLHIRVYASKKRTDEPIIVRGAAPFRAPATGCCHALATVPQVRAQLIIVQETMRASCAFLPSRVDFPR